MNDLGANAARRTGRAGLSLIEVVVSTMLVSVVLVGAMDLLGSVTSSRSAMSDEARAGLLAQQLMAEILGQSYVDGDLLPLFGPELLEADGTRSNFDDVDDYHSWTASPPQNRSGAALPNCSGWRETVAVEYVSASSPSTVALLDSGVKRITVTIQYNGRTLARLVGLRTNKY